MLFVPSLSIVKVSSPEASAFDDTEIIVVHNRRYTIAIHDETKFADILRLDFIINQDYKIETCAGCLFLSLLQISQLLAGFRVVYSDIPVGDFDLACVS